MTYWEVMYITMARTIINITAPQATLKLIIHNNLISHFCFWHLYIARAISYALQTQINMQLRKTHLHSPNDFFPDVTTQYM